MAAADHEFIDPMHTVVLHDVPNDRTTANFDHRLGLKVRFFADARPITACKYD